MTIISEEAHELANTTPFKERARQYFLLSIIHVEAILLGEEEREAFEGDEDAMGELDVLWHSFNSEEMTRIKEMGDSLNGMIRFVDGVGADPKKPITRNEHGAWINAE